MLLASKRPESPDSSSNLRAVRANGSTPHQFSISTSKDCGSCGCSSAAACAGSSVAADLKYKGVLIPSQTTPHLAPRPADPKWASNAEALTGRVAELPGAGMEAGAAGGGREHAPLCQGWLLQHPRASHRRSCQNMEHYEKDRGRERGRAREILWGVMLWAE